VGRTISAEEKMIMQISGDKRRFMGILTGLAILALPHGVLGQDKKSDSETAKFDSVDGVELHGTFYPGRKPKTPAVLILHRYGGDHQGWENLAEKLQDKGFAVLAFDFRGHGESTKISPEFWKVSANSNLIQGAKQNRKTIRFGDFKRSYMPMLANDITAAKRYLDNKNDASECNTSNLILVGAEEGAALGCLWMNEEWDHWPRIKNFNNVWYKDPQGKWFGEDIAAAIWISPTASLDRKSVGPWLEKKEIREKTPMVFYASKEDPTGAAAASQLFEDLKKRNKLDLSFLQLVKAGKARGVDLVNNKDLKVPVDIGKYLEKVIDKRGVNAWRTREKEKSPLEFVPLQQRFGYAQLP
jgi:pimeloyl-ACP methyl ester carboxylesterase